MEGVPALRDALRRYTHRPAPPDARPARDDRGRHQHPQGQLRQYERRYRHHQTRCERNGRRHQQNQRDRLRVPCRHVRPQIPPPELRYKRHLFSIQSDKSALTELLDKAETQGFIEAEETDKLDKAGLVLTADGPTDYLLAEVSIAVQQDDIDRAAERARLLTKATRRTVTPFAIGMREQPDLQHVQVILIPQPQTP